MKIQPMRNMVVVVLDSPPLHTGKLTVIQEAKPAQIATVESCGPEVHDIQPGQRVVINTLAATRVDGRLLVSDGSILGVL